METEIIRSRRKTVEIQIKNDRVILRVPYYATERDIEDLISRHSKWIDKKITEHRENEKESVEKLTEEELSELFERAKKVIPERAAYYAPIIGVKYGRITVRKQKTRWGSCSAKGNLSFNCLLMLAPGEVADSVIVHELCHLKEMNHSARFYAEIARVMPDYKERNAWLKKNGRALLLRAGKI